MDDYNIDLLHHQSHNKKKSCVFLESMFSHNMYPLISKPTRITSRYCTWIDDRCVFMNAFHENVETGLLYTDNNNNNNVPFLYSAYHIQMASLCARGIITPALALMQPFSAKSILRNKFLLGTHLLHLGRERQLWAKYLV